MSAKGIYKQIRLIFMLIGLGLAIFALLALYIVGQHGAFMALSVSDAIVLKTALLLLALVGIPSSYMFQNRIIKNSISDQSVTVKMVKYRRVFFIKIMTLEGLMLMSLLCFLATAQYSYISVFGIFSLLYLCRYLEKIPILNSLLIYCSKASFFILAYHVFIKDIFALLFDLKSYNPLLHTVLFFLNISPKTNSRI